MISHSTNPLVEQRELLAGERIVEPDRTAVEITGADRLTWLHSMLSQDIANLKPGDSSEALLLSPQGRIEHVLGVLVGKQSVFLLTSTESVTALVQYLGRMVFRSAVAVRIADELVVVGGFDAIPELAKFSCWVDAWPTPAAGGYRYASASFGPWGYREWLVPKNRRTKLKAELAGSLAFNALRIAAARPAASDIDDLSLPHEFDWLTSAVHLSKGCYRGQEAVAKTHNLGHPPRRLVLLSLESGDQIPDDGAPIRVRGELDSCGRVCVAANHFEQGGMALALVKRSLPLELELEVQTESGSWLRCVQIEVVPPDAGRVAPAPRMPKLNLSGRG